MVLCKKASSLIIPRTVRFFLWCCIESLKSGDLHWFPRDDKPQTPPGPEGSNGSGGFGCRGDAGVGRLHFFSELTVLFFKTDNSTLSPSLWRRGGSLSILPSLICPSFSLKNDHVINVSSHILNLDLKQNGCKLN